MDRKQKVTLALFSLLLAIQPGWNTIQQYTLHPGVPQYQESPIAIPTEATIPVPKNSRKSALTAKAAIVIDVESGAILYEKNPDVQLYPASLTKLMTALVALDTYPLDREITVREESQAIGNTIKLQQGEVVTVQNLLKGLLIASGNDAAFTLANAHPAGYEGFIQKMNEKAKDFHMDHTVYQNASGVEQTGHLTTVRDMATLTKEAMKIPFVRETVKTRTFTITDTSGKIVHQLLSTNKLLGVVDGIEGVKTGWTTDAGECLITQTTRNGHTIITVVLGSQDRFGESATLISWAFTQFGWKHYRFDD
ncbi:MAG: D-alanyl-D-alanine carboxypeptidase [Candidatus Pacebacteria bacterium]|nr:D-alanyl-D-alanine carboxypeptidase [Candidatus Paceibacterota bacterium]